MTVQQRATLDDVARLAGVSAKTVSRVFNQRELVGADTVERVLASAKRLRFRPNTLAQGLRRGGKTNTVGFIMGEFGNPFYYKVASGIERELAAQGHRLVVATTDDTSDGEARVADALLSQRIDALLIIPASHDQSYLEGERQLGTPVIAIDRPALNLAADSVVLENRETVHEATRRLLALGHRRIGYICNPADVWSQTERIAGYRAAMAEAGITDTTAWARLEDDRSVRPERLIRALLEQRDAPTAIIAGNNRMTIAALRVMRELGDGHTALLGFDDFDTADVLDVSVITYDPIELGRRAARLALARMGKANGPTKQLVLPSWIVERGSGERAPAEPGR
ncbi:LacI family transcriptional regulator [Agromyces sp. SYSU K20354]|uniref:LacI family DNA-binding transcriptional regulator n=1 Tax=Agromyces cavernae TaxID=2898659 RepID=UPI001E578512|nr:LacI family DNA-binding transcriptional regulator [Agromyces cavernae]MCD2440887.1 LacI family transcriptional regulator [Agromyces cavernae]